MKNLRKMIVLTVSLLTLAAVAAPAQTKIASVDMKKLFNGYYKKQEAEKILDKERQDALKNVKAMADDIDKAQKEYQQLLNQVNDPAISADERAKRQKAADDKAAALDSQKMAYESFRRQADASLQEKSQSVVQRIVADIQKVVSEKAKAGGYTLVVNTASPEAIVYVNPDADLTAAVLAELNASAPPDAFASPPASGSLPLNISTNLP